MGFIILLVCMVIIILDLTKKIDITGKYLCFVSVLFLPHIIVLFHVIWQESFIEGLPQRLSAAGGLTILYLYCLLRFHFFTFRQDATGNLRLKILYGGQMLIRSGLWGLLLQFLCYVFLFSRFAEYLPFTVTKTIWISDAVVCALILSLFVINGAVRILFTCRRLGLVKRILVLCNLWIPAVNLFLMHYICRKAKEEYDHEYCRFEAHMERADSESCKTRYPVIMVHGIGFRDLRYFNYWGRVPRELVRNGATVYYGHQEAWGTIEDNARCIGEKITEVLKENNCEKVNIIAHSKGGLDARYLISALHMDRKIASLTTVSTPHCGSELITVLNRLPDGLYRKIASLFDRTFKKVGDNNPDCYHASKQLDPQFVRSFNEQCLNMPDVYYQSYTSVMKNAISDGLLSIPYLIMKTVTGEANDGLVTVSSSVWGEFRGVLKNRYSRGISHADMIDLKREDYKGIDIIEEYVKIVMDLKNKGF